MKSCKTCHQRKALEAFNRNGSNIDGREGSCRECRKALRARWEIANRDRRRLVKWRWLDRRPGYEAERSRRRGHSARSSFAAWAEKYPERLRLCRQARSHVRTALRNGSIVKPSQCGECGRAQVGIEAAHADYSRPLDIRWLCRRCHLSWDQRVPKFQAAVSTALAS